VTSGGRQKFLTLDKAVAWSPQPLPSRRFRAKTVLMIPGEPTME
jgi:hypothetical protein